MTKTTDLSRNADNTAYEFLVAEEELILQAQMMIQRALNDRKITQKALAERLGVGESYISQMMGASARNLTLRTIARVLKALGAAARIELDDDSECVEACAVHTETHDDGAQVAAVASKIAWSKLTCVWGDLVTNEPSAKKAGRRRANDAEAYAAFDPPMDEMALAA